jgi:transcriptional regulator with XRE-family HTH domain
MSNAPTTQRSRIAVEESFVVDVQSYLQELMNLRGVNRSELAGAMGVSRGRISQIFSDECTNLTVRLLARAAHALGEEPQISSTSVDTLRGRRHAARRSEAIQLCDNVVPLGHSAWIDESKIDEDVTVEDTTRRAATKFMAEKPVANNDDARLDALVELARQAAGAR